MKPIKSIITESSHDGAFMNQPTKIQRWTSKTGNYSKERINALIVEEKIISACLVKMGAMIFLDQQSIMLEEQRNQKHDKANTMLNNHIYE